MGSGRLRDVGLRLTYHAYDDRLREFYIPALRVAVSYDRMVGYWRSSSLVLAAQGLTYFIRNASEYGGRMRIIAGAELTDADVEALVRGEPIDEVLAHRLLTEPESVTEDVVARERLRIVAWMLREGLLEVKIGVPTRDGRPLTGWEAAPYFHSKVGILTDPDGDRVVFQGSVNESVAGWRDNHEGFSVFPSWIPEVWESYGQPWVDSFEAHWNSEGPVAGWRIVDLPEAVSENLIHRVLDDESWTPPKHDPVEHLDEAARQLAELAEAPRRGGGTGVGFVTIPITPWPHQLATAGRVVETWPRSYLLSDEVGLGKTIEAGMIIRELLLAGKAQRVLILVPASVQRQWQEELWEKFCLDVPSYQAGRFIDYNRNTLPWDGGSIWGAFPVMLASSHLARMRNQREAILSAESWDLVVVDEAHHARRRGIGGREGANQLLQLLREMKQAGKWKALLLATATPMQMNTTELFDLLDLVGLPGTWAEHPDRIDAYFRQLAEQDPKARDWELLRRMLADHLNQPDVQPDPVAKRQLTRISGPGRLLIENLHRNPTPPSVIASRPPEERQALDLWLRANTPLRDRIFRTSRAALNEYRKAGILPEEFTVPIRHVEDRRIQLEPLREQPLYERIDRYITRYYDEYTRKSETKPLGFIMTIYRRRLTSSLHAIYRSLTRRLEAVKHQARLDGLLDEDDLYVLETTGFEPDDLTHQIHTLRQEIEELESFITDLEAAIPYDTKAQQVAADIHQALSQEGHRSVIVFTQFGDTLEWFRDQLASTYGDQVACYTGKGGSRYNPDTRTWEPVPKTDVKELFRKGHIRILLGTDAMSEGLNLQTCARLFNYDLPWNFTRVEQRIGRIDRIGGQPEIWITNYLYRDTVEDQVYEGLREDAEWFRHVVGPAQPVLGMIENVIQDVAMTPTENRNPTLQLEIEHIRDAIRTYQKRPVRIDILDHTLDPDATHYGTNPAITLHHIEHILTTNPHTSPHLHPHPDFPHTYLIETGGEKHPITFDPAVYDQNPEIGFLTYGHPIFQTLLDAH